MTDFASALKKPATPEPDPPQKRSEGGKAPMNPSRQGTKHIGGYFSPEASRQLRTIAAVEDTSNQKLLAEALDMLFQSRKMPMIANR